MPKNDTLHERGVEAATAYLGRIGLEVVALGYTSGRSTADIIALDGGTLVAFDVTTRRTVRKGAQNDHLTPTRTKTLLCLARDYAEDNGLDLPVRADAITLLVIAEDRALLRHHRDVNPE